MREHTDTEGEGVVCVDCIVIRPVPFWEVSRGRLSRQPHGFLRVGELMIIDPTVKRVRSEMGDDVTFSMVSIPYFHEDGCVRPIRWIPASTFPGHFQLSVENT